MVDRLNDDAHMYVVYKCIRFIHFQISTILGAAPSTLVFFTKRVVISRSFYNVAVAR